MGLKGAAHAKRLSLAVLAVCLENARTLVFVFGLLLLARGLALLSTAAAFIVPGAIIVWLAIPPAATPRKSS